MPQIALIEDYVPLIQLLNLDLREAGYQVNAYQTGEAALAAIPASPPDLVLLDWRLPGIDGIEVCRQLRRQGYTQPIIFVTAMADAMHVRTAISVGANDYLIKPFAARDLLARISHYLHASQDYFDRSAA